MFTPPKRRAPSIRGVPHFTALNSLSNALKGISQNITDGSEAAGDYTVRNKLQQMTPEARVNEDVMNNFAGMSISDRLQKEIQGNISNNQNVEEVAQRFENQKELKDITHKNSLTRQRESDANALTRAKLTKNNLLENTEAQVEAENNIAKINEQKTLFETRMANGKTIEGLTMSDMINSYNGLINAQLDAMEKQRGKRFLPNQRATALRQSEGNRLYRKMLELDQENKNKKESKK